MADSGNFDNGAPPPKRQLPGPFEGYRLGLTDIPVRIRDLSVEGCLVELNFGLMKGTGIRLQIELPDTGWITVRCETLHLAGPNGYVVRFINMDEATRAQLEQAIDRLLSRREGD